MAAKRVTAIENVMSNFVETPPQSRRQANPYAFTGGAVIGALGGLIGLSGAEFRLPLLIGMFGFPEKIHLRSDLLSRCRTV